jgi:hypothetical protein
LARITDRFVRTVYTSNNSACQVGFYAGDGLAIELSKIRFYPNRRWSAPGNYLEGAKFEGSQDNVTWTTISELTDDVRKGWNRINIKRKDRQEFRYLRFSHTSVSSCQIGKIKLKGATVKVPEIRVR